MTGADERKVALVTGGNAGLGFETCKGLLEHGFHVVVCARSREKAEDAVARLLADAPAGRTAESLILDLASLASVREAAASFLASERPLHVLVLNAGIMALPWGRTMDGFEQQWQVNVLGHVLLCRLLLPAMHAARTPSARVVHLSSAAHRRHPGPIDYAALAAEHGSDADFDRWRAYGRSKLANILFSNELARRLSEAGSPITSNAVHPGRVATQLLAKAGGNPSSGIPVEEGARTSLYLSVSPEVEGQTGGYYAREQRVGGRMRTAVSSSAEAARELWASVCRDVGLGEAL